ncbi:hypothetical protein [Nocardia spumae]|uniref:hypothetical protein n=1 Tax=Nocardia spumae TaxID=2887190 RepID=UPI001D13CC1D|nr:hypothetical protein [Nocardia spumae]
MNIHAVHEIFTAQLDNVGPQAPPGTGVTRVVLRNLLWLHLLATLVAVGCWIHLAARRGVARAKVSSVAVGVLILGLATAGAGEILGAAMH